MEYRHLIKNPKYSTIWRKAYGKELGQLAQGIPGTVQGTDTMVFVVDILAAEQTGDKETWYQGTADAVRQTVGFLRHGRFEHARPGQAE